MDAFNIICNCGREPYFATRADLFQKDWMRKLLLSLKMYPVYRLRDGRANLKQNEDAFDFFSQKLQEGKSVGIFPEGGASYYYRLLNFKKGMARLAFKSLEKNPKHPIYVVPSGLQYERKKDYQGELLLQFGKPIKVNDYWSLYQEKPARAIRQLTLDTHEQLRAILIHIPTEDYERINEDRTHFHLHSKGTLLEKFKQEKQMIEAGSFPKTKERSQFDLIPFILFPITILGLFLHYPFRKLFTLQSRKKIKDSQFFATSNFARGLLFFTLYYPIIGFITYWLLPVYFLLAIPLIPVGGRWVYQLLEKHNPTTYTGDGTV